MLQKILPHEKNPILSCIAGIILRFFCCGSAAFDNRLTYGVAAKCPSEIMGMVCPC
jgi:hypothetical protein